MIKATASQLKNKFGQYMRAIREGKEVLITDRDRPVARLVPVSSGVSHEKLVISHPRDPGAPKLGAMGIRGISQRGTDTMTLLREDRDSR